MLLTSPPISRSALILLLAVSSVRAQAPEFSTELIFNEASATAGPVAPDSLASVWGAGLATAVVIPAEGLSESVDGTTVVVTDSAGTERQALIRFVSPSVVSFLVPEGTAPGRGTLTVTNSSTLSSSADIEIAEAAPGLYSANEDGSGAALATFLRSAPDGSREEGVTFMRQTIPGTRTPLPLGFGNEGDELYLSLWGTGFRGASSTTTMIDDVDVPVLAAAAQSEFAGLDQAVIGPLPRELMNTGRVMIELTADEAVAPGVEIAFLEAPGPGAVTTYEFSVRIGQVERLVVSGNTLQWIHVADSAPPPEENWSIPTHLTTTVDGVEATSGQWSFRWPSASVAPGTSSPQFEELWPPLPPRDVQVIVERTDLDAPRPLGSATVIETPSAANAYSLTIEFDGRGEDRPVPIAVRVTVE